MSELSVLEKVTRDVTFKGEALTITPLKVGQIPAFTRAIRPVFSAFAGFFASIPLGDVVGEGGEPTVPKLDDITLDLEKVADLIADHGDSIIEACAVALRKKKSDVEDADLPEFIALVRAIVEVNADFFARAMTRAAQEHGINQAHGNGLMPSNS